MCNPVTETAVAFTTWGVQNALFLAATVAAVLGVSVDSASRMLSRQGGFNARSAPVTRLERQPLRGTGIDRSVPKLLVEARGRDFRWTFRYAGRDRQLGTADDIQSAGELHLPQGVEVELRLHSNDYVYVWECAPLQLREIAVPDLEYVLRFHTQASGKHELLSDPLCGRRALHDDRMGVVIIEPQTQFATWLAGQP